jgi:hypothetical protein
MRTARRTPRRAGRRRGRSPRAGAMWPSAITSREQPAHDAGAHAADDQTFQQRLAELRHAAQAEQALAARERAHAREVGRQAAGLKFQPPSATEASNTRRSGAEERQQDPSNARGWRRQRRPASRRVAQRSGRPTASAHDLPPCAWRGAADATRVTLPPIMVAKLVSSRERGTWPRSRASSSRFCEGSSVRSPPCSDSAISALPPRAPHQVRRTAVSAPWISARDAGP